MNQRTINRSFLPVCVAASALLLPAMMAGCGGGSSSGTDSAATPRAEGTMGSGRAVFSVQWPQAVGSRLIPAAANSFKITLRDGAGAAIAERVIDRPATTTEFGGLPPGNLTAVAAAFPQAGAQGTAQAAGSVPLAIVAGQTSSAALTLNSTVNAIGLAPASPTVVEAAAVTLTPAATDAAGSVVLLAPGALQWASNAPNIAAVDGSGVVTGVAPGQAEIRVTDTESGKSAATVVTVTPRFPYQVIDVGLLSGDTRSAAFGINNAGHIVGVSWNSVTQEHAFIWRDAAEGIRQLSATDAWAISINDNGQIVGMADMAESPDTYVIWEAFDRNAEQLATKTGGGNRDPDPGYALSINNAAIIAGHQSAPNDAVVWDSKTALPPASNQLSAFPVTAAHAVNNHGLVAGWGRTSAGAASAACLWKPLGAQQWQQVLITNAAVDSLAFGINDAGQVVGRYGVKAFVWQEGGALIELDNLGNTSVVDSPMSEELIDGFDRVSGAFDINNNGLIVGDAAVGSGLRHACLWRRNAAGAYEVVDLNTLIDPASGWELLSAKSVNDSGWIVGYGRLNQGTTIRAFLLKPR